MKARQRHATRRLSHGALIVLATLGSHSHPAADPPAPADGATRPFYMGFTPFPYDMTADAVSATNRFVRENGDLVAHHFDAGVPWTEALEDKPFHPALSRKWQEHKELEAGKKVLLSLTPLDGGRKGMALYRGKDENMPLPEAFQNKAFDDPDVTRAYLNYCRRAVEHFRPDYLAIGIEVNELFHHSPQKWPAFVALYRHTYDALKKEHPGLPIFATVTLHNLTNPGWKDRERQQAAIREFLQYNDLAGISYYPFMAGHSETPTATFDWIRRFTDKPLAVAETGYPAETVTLKSFNLTIPSDPKRQADYFETLLKTARRDQYVFVAAFLHRDYDALWNKIKAFSPEAFVVWKDCGLLDETGTERPALAVWRRCFSLEHAPAKPRP